MTQGIELQINIQVPVPQGMEIQGISVSFGEPTLTYYPPQYIPRQLFGQQQQHYVSPQHREIELNIQTEEIRARERGLRAYWSEESEADLLAWSQQPWKPTPKDEKANWKEEGF